MCALPTRARRNNRTARRQEATGFTLGVPEDGTYVISVRAEKAKGTVHVRLSDAGAAETGAGRG